jgi:SAM-dependent methyltransferase
MKILLRFRGKLGDIAIWEDEADGTRFYLEDEIFQSHGSPLGHSQLAYVKIMEAFLCRNHNVLVLGCGGGNLATMLAERGKKITVVDFNPRSFQIAQDISGCPKIFGVSWMISEATCSRKLSASMLSRLMLAAPASASRSSSTFRPAVQLEAGFFTAVGSS